LYRFYSAINRLRLNSPAIRSRNIEIIYVHNANRILAFRRWLENEDILVVTSLNDRPFRDGYVITSDRLSDGWWQEIFNSDAAELGGDSVGNSGATIPSANGRFSCVIPFNGIVVFRRVTA
jgi:1,4-alpha-glucan branching enzyme